MTACGSHGVIEMSDRDGDGERRSKKLIEDRQEKLEAVLDMFSRRAASVDLTPKMKREIAIHIVNYHRVLAKFEGESVLSDGDIPDITPIRERLGRQTKTLTQSSGSWDSKLTYETRPAVDELNFGYLEDVANQLEDAAKKLGFWATADSDVDSDDFSEEDLAALIDTRDQTDAIEDTPDDIRDRVVDEVDTDGD